MFRSTMREDRNTSFGTSTFSMQPKKGPHKVVSMLCHSVHQETFNPIHAAFIFIAKVIASLVKKEREGHREIVRSPKRVRTVESIVMRVVKLKLVGIYF
jgi:hypothetical protein